jgi:transketolase
MKIEPPGRHGTESGEVEIRPIAAKRVGVRDTFAESGPYLELIDKYGLSARHIVAAAEEVLKRK